MQQTLYHCISRLISHCINSRKKNSEPGVSYDTLPFLTSVGGPSLPATPPCVRRLLLRTFRRRSHVRILRCSVPWFFRRPTLSCAAFRSVGTVWFAPRVVPSHVRDPPSVLPPASGFFSCCPLEFCFVPHFFILHVERDSLKGREERNNETQGDRSILGW
mmetsp:Transcript_9880/g.14935  ORF Transcript_9880/g.14935 Transcript_9880/m.14935 type:complete len:160 (-) Transcript_9880:304-783(-)